MALKNWSTDSSSNVSGLTGINWNEGMNAASVNDSARATMAQLAVWRDQIKGGTVYPASVGGTANAITLTCSPTVDAYAAGQRFAFKAASTNTDATTLNVDGLGAKSILSAQADLATGRIQSGDLLVVIYDGTQFQLVSHQRGGVMFVCTTADGSTDDLTILNSAKADLNGDGTGGTIRLQKGVSAISQTLHFDYLDGGGTNSGRYINVRGDGSKASTLKALSGFTADTPVISFTGELSVGVPDIDIGYYAPHLSDVLIDGNSEADRCVDFRSVLFGGPSIDRVSVQGAVKTAFYFENSWNTALRDFWVNGDAGGTTFSDYGVYAYNANQLYAENGYILNTAQGSIAICLDGENEGAHFVNVQADTTGTFAKIGTNHGSIVFDSCWTENNLGPKSGAVYDTSLGYLYGMQFNGTSSDYCSRVDVRNSRLNFGQASANPLYAFDFDYATDVSIRNNYISVNNGSGRETLLRTTSHTGRVFFGSDNKVTLCTTTVSTNGTTIFPKTEDVGGAVTSDMPRFFIPLSEFIAVSGTPTLTTIGTGAAAIRCWDFPDPSGTTLQMISANVPIPIQWPQSSGDNNSFNVYGLVSGNNLRAHVVLHYCTTTSGANILRVQAGVVEVVVGDDASAISGTTSGTSSNSLTESAAAYGVTRAIINGNTGRTLKNTDTMILIKVARAHESGADTSTQVMHLIGVELIFSVADCTKKPT